MEAGRLVSAETLMERVAGAAPHRSGAQLLHTHVTRTRRMLEQAHAADAEPVRLTRRAGGYVLEFPPHRVDVHRFHQLVRRARGDHPVHARAGLLREALDLWRGEPLGGLSGAWVESTREVWLQQRLAAVIAWADATIGAGEPATAIGPLVQELAEHRLAEPLVALLMRALAATGRAAEALEHYAALRERLAEELGADRAPSSRRCTRESCAASTRSSRLRRRGRPPPGPRRPGRWCRRSSRRTYGCSPAAPTSPRSSTRSSTPGAAPARCGSRSSPVPPGWQAQIQNVTQ